MGKIEQISLFKISKFWFFKSALLLSDRFWANILYVPEFFWAESLQKTCLYVHEILQRNPFVESCSNFFIFRPYWFDYLGFLTNVRRGAMRSKNQWDLDWWPGPQKAQFWKITGYPEVVWLILVLLRLTKLFLSMSQLLLSFLCVENKKKMLKWSKDFSKINK